MDRSPLPEHRRLPGGTYESTMERRTERAGHLEFLLFCGFCAANPLSSDQPFPLESETDSGHPPPIRVHASGLRSHGEYSWIPGHSRGRYYPIHGPHDILVSPPRSSFTLTPCSIADCTSPFWLLVFFACPSTIRRFGLG